jgi:hypothetical protein
MRIKRGARLVLASFAAVSVLSIGALEAQADPFKLGVEERGYIQDPNGGGGYEYPSPQMVPTGAPLQGNIDKTVKKKPSKNLDGGVQDSGPRKPMNPGVQKSVPLPQGFLGPWLVSGLRKDLQVAKPEMQAQANTAFAMQTQNTWTISGNPSTGYSFTADNGVKSSIFVDKVSGDTAFIRYQHQVFNTVAREAIVMQLVNGGVQFNGLERITISKPGEPGPPRFKMTYQLIGTRPR